MIWWLIIFIAICIAINIFISCLAKKKNCYEYMMSISTKEAKMLQYLIIVVVIVITTIILEIFGDFKHYEVLITYFSFIVVLSITSSKIAKFILANDLIKKGEYLDTSVSGKEKDKKDAEEDAIKLQMGIAATAMLLVGDKKIKKTKKHSFDRPEKQALKSGEQDKWNFEEEDLEEDDYYSEDE